MKRVFVVFAFFLALGALVFCASCGAYNKLQPVPPTNQQEPPPPLPAPYAKEVSFSICEDYDKNQDLKEIEQDFKLVNELGIGTMRVSFGWDDYEPERGQYDFVWLHEFAKLAEKHNIKLRPYLCYAPGWATGAGWNAPPQDYKDWYNFCYNLAKELKVHPNIVSYEIWNEEDGELWFDGNIQQFNQLLQEGARAIRAADPDKEILLGGFTRPADYLLLEIIEAGNSQYYDVLPFHCYVETWTPPGHKLEDYLTGNDFLWFSDHNRSLGGNKPIWVNEIGYSTLRRTEEKQANYLARAVAHLFSSPDVVHIGWYEIKDLDPGVEPIGDSHNYHLGITRHPDRAPKLAFYTLDVLTDLLDGRTVTPAQDAAKVTVTSGEPERLHHYLFQYAEGGQLLFVYDMGADLTVDITLATPGQRVVKYSIKGENAPYPGFDGTTLKGVKLPRGGVQIFKIEP